MIGLLFECVKYFITDTIVVLSIQNKHARASYTSIYHGLLFSLVVCLGVGVFDRSAPNGLAVVLVVVLVVSTARLLVPPARDEGGESGGGASFVDVLVEDRPFFPTGARLTLSFLTPTSSSGLKCCFLTGNLAVGSICRLWLLAADVAGPAAVEMSLLDLLLLLFATRDEVGLDEATEDEAGILLERPVLVATPILGAIGLVWVGGASLLDAGDGSLPVVLLAVAGLIFRPGDAATLAREEEVGLWRCFIPGSSLSDDETESNVAGDSPRLLPPCFCWAVLRCIKAVRCSIQVPDLSGLDSRVRTSSLSRLASKLSPSVCSQSCRSLPIASNLAANFDCICFRNFSSLSNAVLFIFLVKSRCLLLAFSSKSLSLAERIRTSESRLIILLFASCLERCASTSSWILRSLKRRVLRWR